MNPDNNFNLFNMDAVLDPALQAVAEPASLPVPTVVENFEPSALPYRSYPSTQITHDINAVTDEDAIGSDEEDTAPAASAVAPVQPPPPHEEEEQPSYLSLIDFPIPCYATDSLSTISNLQSLYIAHRATYTERTNPTICLTHTQAVLHILLTYFFPPTHGYTIKPIPLPPIANLGLSLILKDARNRDPSAVSIPNTPAAHFNWCVSAKWHYISPTEMAVFAVYRGFDVTDVATGSTLREDKPHTYVLMIPDQKVEHARLSKANVVLPSDVLADLLCRAGVREGFGLLVVGGRLGFGGFERGIEWSEGTGGKDGGGGPVKDVDPKMKSLMKGKKEVGVDLKKADLKEVGKFFEENVLGRDVVFLDDVIGE